MTPARADDDGGNRLCGACGLRRMRQAGARTLGQDEASCVVYGMPREAALIGAVEEVASLSDIARRVLAILGKVGQTT